jgi:hypothetical protein
MPNPERAHCKRCRQHRDTIRSDGSLVGPISWVGNCQRCGEAEIASNITQMHHRSGPNFNRWRAGMIRCAGGTVTDPRLLA